MGGGACGNGMVRPAGRPYGICWWKGGLDSGFRRNDGLVRGKEEDGFPLSREKELRCGNDGWEAGIVDGTLTIRSTLRQAQGERRGWSG